MKNIATPSQLSDMEYRLSRLRSNCRRISENSGKLLDRFHQLLFPDPLSSLATLAIVQSGRRASLPESTTTTATTATATATTPCLLSLIEATHDQEYGPSKSPRRKRTTYTRRQRCATDDEVDGDDSECDPDYQRPPPAKRRRTNSHSDGSGHARSACAVHQRMHKKCNNDRTCVLDAMRHNRVRTS